MHAGEDLPDAVCDVNIVVVRSRRVRALAVPVGDVAAGKIRGEVHRIHVEQRVHAGAAVVQVERGGALADVHRVECGVVVQLDRIGLREQHVPVADEVFHVDHAGRCRGEIRPRAEGAIRRGIGGAGACRALPADDVRNAYLRSRGRHVADRGRAVVSDADHPVRRGADEFRARVGAKIGCAHGRGDQGGPELVDPGTVAGLDPDAGHVGG